MILVVHVREKSNNNNNNNNDNNDNNQSNDMIHLCEAINLK